MKYLVIATFLVYVGTTYANSSASNKTRIIWNDVKECTKDEKCITFCAFHKLKLADAEGNIQTSPIPYNNYYNNATLLKCMDQNKKKEKCQKVSDVMKCLMGAEKKTYKNNYKHCAKETKFSMPKFSMKSLIAAYFGNKYNCFLRCLLIKEGVIGEDNHFTNDFIATVVIKEGRDIGNVSEVFKKCGEKKDADKCEEVSSRGMCFIEELIFTNI